MIAHFGVFVLVFSFCGSQDYNMDDDYSNFDVSLDDSMSIEVFNVTTKKKPERVKLINDNHLNNTAVTTEDNQHQIRTTKQEITTELYSTTEPTRRTDAMVPTKTTEQRKQNRRKEKIDSFPNSIDNLVSDDYHKSKNKVASYPFAVSLQRKGSHYASGALIDKRWVLSAAGEFYNVRESIKIFRARLGSMDCKRGGTSVPLNQIEIHPSFVLGKPSYDLSLIRLARPMDITDSIRPIPLTSINEKVLSAKFLTTYWPRIVMNGTVLPSTAQEREKHSSMRVSTQKLIPWDKCYRILNKVDYVMAESSLCLRPLLTHHSICLPDIGAPVVANDGLWGITSGWVGRGCSAKHQSPVVITRVSSPHVLAWLISFLEGYNN